MSRSRVQVRYSDGDITFHDSFREAIHFANMQGSMTRSAVKISFSHNGERVRLVRSDNGQDWVLDSLDDLLDAQEDLKLN
jgi:hypothetical protein